MSDNFAEIVKDLLDPLYWATVVPLGTAFLYAMFKYDNSDSGS